MPYARVEPSGCTERHGQVQVRLSMCLEKGDARYDDLRFYQIDRSSPEALLGYQGLVDAEGRPLDQEQYAAWVASLPRVWLAERAFHDHFVYFDPYTMRDGDIEAEIAHHLPNFYKAWVDGWGAAPGGMRHGWDVASRKRPRRYSKLEPARYPQRKADAIAKVNILKASTLAIRPNLSDGETFPSTDIDVGMGGVVGNDGLYLRNPSVSQYTVVSGINVANDDGSLDTVSSYSSTGGGGGASVKVGTFYVSGSYLKCRDDQAAGTYYEGSNEWTGLDLDVVTGDMIGIDARTNYLAVLGYEMTAPSGTVYRASGLFCDVGDQAVFTAYSPRYVSLYGTGETPAMDVYATPPAASVLIGGVAPSLTKTLTPGVATVALLAVAATVVQGPLEVSAGEPGSSDVWVSPVGHTDNGGGWSNEALAYDNDDYNTGAQASDTTSYLELDLAEPTVTDKVRLIASEVSVPVHDEADVVVDVYYGGAWHNIWDDVCDCMDVGPPDDFGIPTYVNWHFQEMPLGSTQTITAIRVKSNSATGPAPAFLYGIQALYLEGGRPAAVIEVGAVAGTTVFGDATVTPAVADIEAHAAAPTIVRSTVTITPPAATTAIGAVAPGIDTSQTPPAATVDIDAIAPSIDKSLTLSAASVAIGAVATTVRTSYRSPTLLDALKSPSVTPLLRAVFTHDADSYTWTDTRILEIDHEMQPLSQTARLVLDNSDLSLNSVDLKGYQCVLSYGAATSAGDQYAPTPPLYATAMRYESSGGRLVVVLELVGIPDLLGEDRANDSYIPTATDTRTVKDIIEDILDTSMSCFSHTDSYSVVWDSEDSLIDSYAPKDGFRIYKNGSRLAALRRLLDYTKCVMRVEADGAIHIFQPDTTDAACVAEYSLDSGEHPFFSKAYRNALILPNRIQVNTPEDADTAYSGSATDSTSYALIPKTQYEECAVTSDAQAASIAEAILSKYRLHAQEGSATVPLDVGLQVFDRIRVTDSRQSDERTGNVGTLRHHYLNSPHHGRITWETHFTFGGWLSKRKTVLDLEVHNIGPGDTSFNRLFVKDLVAENIRADNILLEWLSQTGDVDLSKIGDTLDNLGDGSTYAKLRQTNISAGNILLSSLVEVKTGTNSKWYAVGYVEIDADTGITISGQDLVFELGTQQHYIYPSTDELDIMSESGCDIRFLNGPVKLSCDLDPKSDETYDLGYSTMKFDDIYCLDLHVTNEPWDHEDDLALVRAIRADPQDGGKYDRSTIPPMLKASHRKTEKLEKRRRRIDRDDEDLRAILFEAAIRETRPEKRAQLLARRSRVGSDRDVRIARYGASLNDDSTLSVGNTIGLLIGSVRQLADKVDTLAVRLDNMKGGA